MGGLWGSLLLLTRVPLPGWLAQRGHVAGAAVAWFPFVGALLGGLLAAADLLLAAAGVTPLVRAAVIVTLLAALTGALHLDGLADTADALFSHATPERRMEIMRDPHVGAFGAVALVCILLLKTTAVYALTDRPEALLFAPVLGRWGIAIVAAAFPYARKGGLGEPVKAGATPRALAAASVLPVALGLVLLPAGVLVAAVAALASWLIGRWLCRHLPGLTGDSYGAVCEVVETLALLAYAPLQARLLGTLQ